MYKHLEIVRKLYIYLHLSDITDFLQGLNRNNLKVKCLSVEAKDSHSSLVILYW